MSIVRKLNLELKRAVIEAWGTVEPKSFCTCSHLGDGSQGAHAGPQGHGACTAKGCHCDRFTFRCFVPALAAKLGLE